MEQNQSRNYRTMPVTEPSENRKSFVSLAQLILAVLVQVVVVAIAISNISNKAQANKETIIEVKTDIKDFKAETTANQKAILEKLDKLNDKLDHKVDKTN